MLIRRTLQILSQNTGFRFLEPISKLEKPSKQRLLPLANQDRVLEKGNSQSLRSTRSGRPRIHRYRSPRGLCTGRDGNPGDGRRSIDD
jgi:hypothetical protein